MRKIVHIDMDAFYAAVEQRDDPALRGRPVIVAWRGPRSVVCAASYEARRYGVRSAMPALRAARLCPAAVFVPPDFDRYRAVSRQVRAILLHHADRVEPLSLDEAYLDVTKPSSGSQSATAIARRIKREILEATGLTASAGVAPNKFLAKIASDWQKPDGLTVITPNDVEAFLAPLPVAKLPGVGRVLEARLAALGVTTCAHLRRIDPALLATQFGRIGMRLAELARGIDERPVEPDRPVQSISSEDTFAQDLPLPAVMPMIHALAAKTWAAARRTERIGRTVVLKLKTANFHVLTRRHTPASPPRDQAELAAIASSLAARVALPPTTRYRLLGVGLTNFCDRAEVAAPASLFPIEPDES
jgi:DNA polymerase-4